MRDIEELIREHCAKILPREPAWIGFLNQRFPKIAKHIDGVKSARWEIEDHLRSLYDACLANGHHPEEAWKLSRERFGDVTRISAEIRRARIESRKCLIVRLLAITALFALPLEKAWRLRVSQFIHAPALFLMAAFTIVGCLITHKRDMDSLRKYALCGAWLGLFLGILKIIAARNLPAELGGGVALILISTFYGLFLAMPAARGFASIAMMLLCQVGVMIALIPLGFISAQPIAPDSTLLRGIAAAWLVTMLVSYSVYDIRRLGRRLAGMAVFGMVFAFVQILSNFNGSYISIWNFVYATSIPPLLAVLTLLSIQRLQNRFLSEVN